MERAARAYGVVGVTWLWLATVLALCLGTAPRPAMAEFEVKSPLVEPGALELEWHGNVQSGFSEEEEEDEEEDDEGEGVDDEDEENVRQEHELSIGYGVTSFWQPELALSLEQRKGRDLKVDSIGFENTFQLLPTNAYPVNLGLIAAYELSVRDDVHALELGPLVQLPIGRLTNTANAIFEQQFGDDRESASTAFEYAWQSVFAITPGFELGFEAYGEIEQFAEDAPSLSEQAHRIGPVSVFATKLGNWGELSVGIGLLFGLTDETPDHTFKFDVELEWGGADDDDNDDDDAAAGGAADDDDGGDADPD